MEGLSTNSAEYHKIDTATRKDYQKICRQKMSIMFNQSFLSQLEAIFSDFVDQSSKHVV